MRFTDLDEFRLMMLTEFLTGNSRGGRRLNELLCGFVEEKCGEKREIYV
jgi:hypothetical protein